MANRKVIKVAAVVLIAMSYADSQPLTLNDLYITVKTTQKYQYTRLPIILITWFQLAKNQTWFFTDTDNPLLQKITNGHMINTMCPPSHNISDLCCKTGYEYDYYLKTNKKWFCHFDDDNYVNVPRLLEVLQAYDYNKFWYLGQTAKTNPHKYKTKQFWYGTGGAGYCLSRSLALKLQPFISDGRFRFICQLLDMPDDINLGYIIYSLGTTLTKESRFHSEYDTMGQFTLGQLKDQVTFSYRRSNVVNVPGFSIRYDPTRFLSLHCFLFRQLPICANTYYKIIKKKRIRKALPHQRFKRKRRRAKPRGTPKASAARKRLVHAHSRVG